MTTSTLGEKLIAWARAEPSVHLLALIGSQLRSEGAASADRFSDWDFQIVTSQPEMFGNAAWTSALALQPLAYVARSGRLGSVQKVTALFAEGELDLVIIPAAAFRGLAVLIKSGQHTINPAAMQALTDQAAVLQGGYRLLKGQEEFADLYNFIVRDIPPPRLSDAAVVQLAAGFVCDYVSTRRKIERGELLAAQRWLHHQLAETNFRLLHELRLREDSNSFPDARRLEMLRDPRQAAVTVEATLSADSIRAAVEHAANACRLLMTALVGAAWRWPDLTPLRLGGE